MMEKSWINYLVNDKYTQEEFLNLIRQKQIKPAKASMTLTKKEECLITFEFPEYRCAIHAHYQDIGFEEVQRSHIKPYGKFDEIPYHFVDNQLISLLRQDATDRNIMKINPVVESFLQRENISNPPKTFREYLTRFFALPKVRRNYLIYYLLVTPIGYTIITLFIIGDRTDLFWRVFFMFYFITVIVSLILIYVSLKARYNRYKNGKITLKDLFDSSYFSWRFGISSK